MRHLLLTAFLAIAAHAADRGVAQSAARLDDLSAKAPKAVGVQLRMLGAQALYDRYPDLSRKFVDSVLGDLRSASGPAVGPAISTALFELPLDDALALFTEARAHGKIQATEVSPLLSRLAKEKPELAGKLFDEAVASFTDPLEPGRAWNLINLANTMATGAPAAAARAYERVLDAASAPDFGQDAKTSMRAQFQIGTVPWEATGSRDTILLAAAGRLRAVAPDRLAKYQEVLAPWKISGPITMRSFSMGSGSTPAPTTPSAFGELIRRIGTMRSLATDADRAKLVLAVVPEIRQLPASYELSAIRSLAGTATEGDLGKEALTAVATTLSAALHDNPPRMMVDRMYTDGYIEVAKLTRYEHVTVPGDDPARDAADALLELRERVQAEIGFTLTDLSGKTWSLSALRGKIVLLNFWATWCPPCRREMPDMEKLYRTYGAQGLIVLAVSDEQRSVVETFLAKNPYTFPVLLDPERKLNTAFTVEGIPKSFIFDREGRLAAMAIDMRTESQFLELLKQAGLP
jgi:peroxiredoxin